MPDGKSVDLREEGAREDDSLDVAYGDRYEWIDRALKARLV